MALYEPSAFHLLRQMGERGAEPYAEITGVARTHLPGRRHRRLSGSCCCLRRLLERARQLERVASGGAERPDPLGAKGTARLPRVDRRSDAGRAPIGALTFPVLILRGEHAPSPTRVIAEGLAELLPASRLVDIAGAGHMGPLTHAPEVSALIVRHIVESRSRCAAASEPARAAGPTFREPHARRGGGRVVTYTIGQISRAPDRCGAAGRRQPRHHPPDPAAGRGAAARILSLAVSRMPATAAS